ncbi:MAG TPA: hypothetical protein VGQ31_02085 [Candidatus Limnocylindrales bacterium]|nr:hypothetical protein [Candidatus Limnocylindrales bacterium]
MNIRSEGSGVLEIAAHQGDVLFGVARRDITPPVGIYGRWWPRATWDRVTGVHRPLTATAMVLRNPAGMADEGDEEIIVAMDMCLLYATEQEIMATEVRRRTGVAGQFMCTYSHTHSSPPTKLDQAGLPGGELIRPYLDTISEQVAAAVTEARAAIQPATIAFGRAESKMGGNRDLWDPVSEQWVCGFNPDGAFDPTVLVGRVSGVDGTLLATMVNYSCHPTTLAWQNSLISPDYPGAMREVVEAATGVPCIFLQGASGDTGPRDGFVGDTAVADRNGRELGYAALSALESIPAPRTRFRYQGPSISGTTLGLWDHEPFSDEDRIAAARWRVRRWTVPLAYRSDLPSVDQAYIDRERWTAEEAVQRAAGDELQAADCRGKAEQANRLIDKLGLLPPGPDYPLPVMVMQTGDVFWVAVEDEHYNVLQRALRESVPDVDVVVMTLMDGGRVAYLPTADTYGKGLYQETIAVLAPGSLERLIDEVSEQLMTWWSDQLVPAA